MFEQTFLVGTGRTRRPWTVPLSFSGQVGVVGLLVLAPLVFTERLPRAGLMPLPLTAPIYVRTPKPKPAEFVTLVSAKPQPAASATIFEPTRIPRGVARVIEPPAPQTEPQATCIGPCIATNDPNLVTALPPRYATQFQQQAPAYVEPVKPEAPPDEAARQVVRIRVGGLVQAGKLVTRVEPVYPRIAVEARITGSVVLKAVIGIDGRIRELQVASGHPMLVKAAVDAVRQWVYSPTLLNGNRVEVATEVVVNFVLRAA